jgi:hypothetical protein
LIFTSYTDGIYPEPLYYEIKFNDGVTHLWSREIIYDYYGMHDEIQDRVNNRYKNMSIDSLNYIVSWNQYLESRKRTKEKRKKLLQNIN